MDKEYIEKEALLKAFCAEATAVMHEGKPTFMVNYPRLVKEFPAAAINREMSAREYLRVAHRLCHGKEVACAECPLHGKKGNLGICLHMSMDMIAINFVEQWAREHPEERSEQ